MITIYTIAFNEQFMLPHFISFYRNRFAGCRIVVYNNLSTDNTSSIAQSLGCEVRDYDTGGKLSDQTYIDIKNNCWKDSLTEWVIVCDVDEWLDVTPEHLRLVEGNILTSMECVVINTSKVSFLDIDHARPYDVALSKRTCFKKSQIKEINYQIGAHLCNPVAKDGFSVKFSKQIFMEIHVRFINFKYMRDRHRAFGKRLPQESIKKGYSKHYKFSTVRMRLEWWRIGFKAIQIKSLGSLIKNI